jgi:hypothetical protein
MLTRLSVTLNGIRDEAIRKAYSGIQLLKQNLYAGKAGCSNACNAMLLGSLMQGLHRSNLLAFAQPLTSQSFTNIRLDLLWGNLLQIETPASCKIPHCKKRHSCKLAPLLGGIF